MNKNYNVNTKIKKLISKYIKRNQQKFLTNCFGFFFNKFFFLYGNVINKKLLIIPLPLKVKI